MKKASEIPDEMVEKALQAEHEDQADKELVDEFGKWSDYFADSESQTTLRAGMRAALAAVWEDIYASGYTDGFSDKTSLEGE